MPNCDLLPRYNKSSKFPTCSYVGLTEINQKLVTYDCRLNAGRYYLGNINVTSTGIPCQKWTSQIPHQHITPLEVFPEVRNAENYCRNIAGMEDVPWCYTEDKAVRWQKCDVPLCPNSSESNIVDSVGPIEMENVFTPTLIFILGGVGLIVIVLIHICVLLTYRILRYNKRNHATAGFSAVIAQENIDVNKLPSNMSYHQTGAQLNPKLEKLEYPRNDIIYIKDLGQGNI